MRICETTVRSMQDKFAALRQKVRACQDYAVWICNMMQIVIASDLCMTACLHCWANTHQPDSTQHYPTCTLSAELMGAARGYENFLPGAFIQADGASERWWTFRLVGQRWQVCHGVCLYRQFSSEDLQFKREVELMCARECSGTLFVTLLNMHASYCLAENRC